MVYRVGDSVILAAGRPGEHLQRGVGVALVLMGPAVAAWRGVEFKTCLNTPKIGKRKGETFHLMSCYAPMQAASRKDKSMKMKEYSQTCQNLMCGTAVTLKQKDRRKWQ